jgi:hypothetical protein
MRLILMQPKLGRRPPISGLPEIGFHRVRKSAKADLRWLTRPEEAG